VEHVEATGVGDAPQRGQHLVVRAFVALGDLAREDVMVELVSGRVDHNDRIVNRRVMPLTAREKYEGNRWRYEAEFDLVDTGAFGYTVRVLPSHPGLRTAAELGVQALPL
jgi:starch phosphorylase